MALINNTLNPIKQVTQNPGLVGATGLTLGASKTGLVPPPQKTPSLSLSGNLGATLGQSPIKQVTSNPGLIPTPKNSGLVPTPNPTANIQSQLTNLQGQLKTAQDAGYSGTTPIQYGQNGQIMPNTQNNQVAGTSSQIPPIAPIAPIQTPQNVTGQPGLVSTTPPPVTYPGLVSNLGNFSPTSTLGYQDALKGYQGAVQNLSDFNQNLAKQYGGIESQPIPLEFQQGREQVLARQAASQGSALQGAVNQQQAGLGYALQGSGQQLNALNSAAGYAQPQLAGYSQQAFNPLSGQFSGGGNLQDAVNGVVQKLQSGQMTYNDALNALSGYGQGGVNALQQALPQGFNIAQSNTLAGQQGSIGINYQLADTALKNVENIIGSLGDLQKTNIPLVNKGANWFSTQFGVGSEQTRAMTGAVQSLRNAYASLLASAKGGTPTDYSGQAQAEIPNEPTPNDIAAIRQNFETLGRARASILGNPGQSNGNTNQSNSGNLYAF